MMSSEEDVETMAMEDKALKTKKRVRQRVDAGEPRNSYASIPNFSSRPSGVLPYHNGYMSSSNKMLSDLLVRHVKEEPVMLMDSTVDPRVNGTSPGSCGIPLSMASTHTPINRPVFLNGTGSELAHPYMRSGNSPPTSPVSENTHLLRDILQGRKQSSISGEYNGGGSVSPPGRGSPTGADPSVVLGSLLKGNVQTSGSHASETLGEGGVEPSGAGSRMESRTPEKEGSEDSESKSSSRMSDHDTGPSSLVVATRSSPVISTPVSSPSLSCSPTALRPPPIGMPVANSTWVSTPNSLEVKRARVENIVSNMMQIPVRTLGGSGPGADLPPPVNGCKKRKLYQPQQHEVGRCLNGIEDEEEYDDLSPRPKREKLQHIKLKLRQMEQQIMDMQQQYRELTEADCTDDEGDPNHGSSINNDVPSDMQLEDNNNHRQRESSECDEQEDCPKAQTPMSPSQNDVEKDNSRLSPRPLHSRTYGEMHGHIFEEMRRLMSEQEKASREMNEVKPYLQEIRQSCIVRPPSRGGIQSSSQDIEWLVDSLKTEMSTSLTNVIDSVVAQYIQRRHMAKVASSESEPPKDLTLLSQMLDRKSPRTKVIDRGNRVNGHGMMSQRTSPFPDTMPKPPFFFPPAMKPPTATFFCSTPQQLPPVSLQPYQSPVHTPLGLSSAPSNTTPLSLDMPEQTEAMSLVVTPKKKRHKVTDTRITPRTVSRVLGQDPDTSPKYPMLAGLPPEQPTQPSLYPHHPPPPPLVPVTLPTTVAIPNPSLHQSEVYSGFHYDHPRLGHYIHESVEDDNLLHNSSSLPSSLLGSHGHRGSPDSLHFSHMKQDNGEGSDPGDSPAYDSNLGMTSTLTPMHLRKAKLMFFYARYPSSAILKMFFPDIKFNKNNTAQLVKWFSNFREFYYIQMEKYARQAITEGIKNPDDLRVNADSELLRVLNLHYNRNNHIEGPENFRNVVEQTLREFFRALIAGKDNEQSWKKAIYKVIARLDDNVPEYFKSPNFLEQLE